MRLILLNEMEFLSYSSSSSLINGKILNLSLMRLEMNWITTNKVIVNNKKEKHLSVPFCNSKSLKKIIPLFYSVSCNLQNLQNLQLRQLSQQINLLSSLLTRHELRLHCPAHPVTYNVTFPVNYIGNDNI